MKFIDSGIFTLIQIFFRLSLSIIFFVSSFSKVRNQQQFIATIHSYDIVPKTWAKPLAFVITGIEFAASFLLFIGWQTRLTAVLCVLLLAAFSVAMGINLMRGRMDLECGCFGVKRSQKITIQLVGRNAVLSLMAVGLILWGGGQISFDNYLFVWQTVLFIETFLPAALTCIGMAILSLLVLRLFRLLLLMPLEE